MSRSNQSYEVPRRHAKVINNHCSEVQRAQRHLDIYRTGLPGPGNIGASTSKTKVGCGTAEGNNRTALYMAEVQSSRISANNINHVSPRSLYKRLGAMLER